MMAVSDEEGSTTQNSVGQATGTGIDLPFFFGVAPLVAGIRYIAGVQFAFPVV